ncbi:PFL_4703 family integrating conjugative element protein [Pasteurella multocida]|uniref:PFL_4703 family integrating conjugative element protein n=1 Tax=Pasteurella multocida TaxID=747 RepID=UPI003BFA2D01
MSNYKNMLIEKENSIKRLTRILYGVGVLALAAIIGWMNAPRNLTVHNPPDLRAGSSRPWWEVPPSTVYSFGFYIFQQLNRWPTNGREDYRRNIPALSPYLTPSCQNYLEQDYKDRDTHGELNGRVRGVYEIPGRGFNSKRVEVLSHDSWIVNLDLAVDEYYGEGDQVKRSLVRFPLHIVRYDIDAEKNPWGLALDCYADMPKRLEAAPVEDKK